MSDTTILEGPDGRLYEIPNDTLAETLAAFVVPGERVAELRRRMAEAAGRRAGDAGAGGNGEGHDSGAMPPGHSAMPPGHSAMPPGQGAIPPGPGVAAPGVSVNPGGGVVLNFYFQAPPPGGAPATNGHNMDLAGVQGYHMSFDDSGIPMNHADMLWGDYIDKQGNAAVGWHSHDPVTGNAL